MNWRVFKRDDPNTWPEIDCKFLVCYDYDQLAVCEWDKTLKCFYDENGFAEYWECYYSYIGYIPNGYKTHKTLHCLNDNNCKIGCDDDGYCLYDFCKCEQQVEVNEYEVETKRIWKEF